MGAIPALAMPRKRGDFSFHDEMTLSSTWKHEIEE